MDLLFESIRLANLPYTIFLGLIVLFWFSVILGAMDMETLDFDFDMEADVDIEVDVDADVDMDAEASTNGMTLGSFLSWLNLGAVPFSLWLSIFGLFAWIQSIVGNVFITSFGLTFLNDGFRFLLLSIAILPISATITRFSVIPLRPAFKTKDAITNREMVREVCKITSSEVTLEFGLAEIVKEGGVILINVRAAKEENLRKGDTALVVSYNKQKNIYEVARFDHEKLNPPSIK
ncbi:MAG: hypothetical protein AAF518_07615 [Spirochaetota bacterium]